MLYNISRLRRDNMLSIYTDRSLIAKDNIIYDNEAFFRRNTIKDEDAMRSIIKAIDLGEFIDTTKFEDRFGVVLYTTCLSTGAKTLINIANSDKVINGCELGQNAVDYMLWNLNGRVFFKKGTLELDECVDYSRILINNKHVNNLSEVEELL